MNAQDPRSLSDESLRDVSTRLRRRLAELNEETQRRIFRQKETMG